MEREIKFRVWHKIEKRWLPLKDGAGSHYKVLTIDAQDGIVSMTHAYGLEAPIMYAADAIVLMQYTGLKDKNGKEIYEGDLLRFKNMETLAPVAFRNGSFGYMASTLLEHISFNQNAFNLKLDEESGIISTMEIVGNLYDNPELLK